MLTAAVDARGTPPGSKVTLGVRPEHVRAVSGADAQKLTVRFVESLGSVLYAYGAAPGTEADLPFGARDGRFKPWWTAIRVVVRGWTGAAADFIFRPLSSIARDRASLGAERL